MRERKRKAPMIWTVIIGLVMVLSVIGFMYQPSGESAEKYNGYRIYQAADGYYVKINDRQVRFSYHPASLAQYAAEQPAIDSLKDAKMVFMTFNPEDEAAVLSGIDLARFELSSDLGDYFGIVVQQAAALNTTLYDLPVITCANATATQPVMQFKTGNDTKIYKEGDCIVLEAFAAEDFMLLRDRLLYGMFDIIR